MNSRRSRPAPGQVTTPQVHSITAAATSHTADLNSRVRRYLVSMGIRTVCVILVVIVPGPARWVFAVLAIVLPYIAVVMANVARKHRGSPAVMTGSPVARPALPAVDLRQDPPISDVRSDASAERTRRDSHERTA